MYNHALEINIPAYDASNKGLIIKVTLASAQNSSLVVQSTGNVADALQRNFRRIVHIMSSLKHSWKCLLSMSYLLACTNNQFVVKESKSSSMAFSIALINLCRAMNGQPQVQGLTGTGILRIDGSFDKSHQEEKKSIAAKENEPSLHQFITPNEAKNLFELERLVNQLY